MKINLIKHPYMVSSHFLKNFLQVRLLQNLK